MFSKINVKMIFLIGFVLSGLINNAIAFDPSWKKEQTKIFEKIAIKPGDIITASKSHKLKDLVPNSMIEWVKKGEWTFKIGEFKFDFSPDEQWEKDALENKGKYSLAGGEIRYIVNTQTGVPPQYVYGYMYMATHFRM